MGSPEFVAVLAMAIPVVAAAWIVLLVNRMLREQRAIRDKLGAIERSLQRRPPS